MKLVIATLLKPMLNQAQRTFRAVVTGFYVEGPPRNEPLAGDRGELPVKAGEALQPIAEFWKETANEQQPGEILQRCAWTDVEDGVRVWIEPAPVFGDTQDPLRMRIAHKLEIVLLSASLKITADVRIKPNPLLSRKDLKDSYLTGALTGKLGGWPRFRRIKA